jgi:hypothetical protein
LVGSLLHVGGERSTGPSQILSRDPEDLFSNIERGESSYRRIWTFSRNYNPSGVNLSERRVQIRNSAPHCVVKRNLLFGCSLLRHYRSFPILEGQSAVPTRGFANICRSQSLKAARARKRLTTGKCEGRKSHAEINFEMVQIARGLRRRKRGNSLRAIAADLAARGYVNVNGREYSAASVASMLGPKG